MLVVNIEPSHMFTLNVDHDGKMVLKTLASTWWCCMLGVLLAHRHTVLLVHIMSKQMH